jgi:hypothetical protein
MVLGCKLTKNTIAEIPNYQLKTGNFNVATLLWRVKF